MFRYAVEPNAPLYRALAVQFLEAKLRYELRLRPAAIASRLPAPYDELEEDVLVRALEQLVEWGNLKRLQDTERARNLEEFLRRRSLYQLTPEGEAAEKAIREVEGRFGRRGALQAFMLPEVLGDLRELVRLGAAGADPGALYVGFGSLFAKFDELVDNAGLFMATLNDEIDRGDLADDAFRTYKQAVVVYLDNFLTQLSQLGHQIRETISEVEDQDVERLMALAASADAAPSPDGTGDPVAERLAHRWTGLRSWFLGGTQDAPVLDSLRSAGIEAVRRLLGILGRVNDRRYRRVNRTTDLLQLARWFERSDDDSAHELFRIAFGTAPARHMGAPVDDDGAGTGRSWWSAPPAEIPAHMRRVGRTAPAGSVAVLADHGEAKRLLLERTRAERMAVERAAERFAGKGALRVADLGWLESDEFVLFLTLVERAIRGPARDGTRRGTSSDGRFRVLLSDPVGEDCVFGTPGGELTCPNFAIEVTPAEAFTG